MKNIGTLLIAVLLIGAGFWIRGVMPVGGPPSGMPGRGNMPPPAVIAQVMKEQPLDTRTEYIAAIEPIQEVAVRSEVSGYIDAVHFTEGALVKEGDLLFTIDRKPYQAMVERAGSGAGPGTGGADECRALPEAYEGRRRAQYIAVGS